MKLVPISIDRLDELVALWNKELKEDFPMRKELFKQNSFVDQNVLTSASRLAIDENNQIIGFVIAKKWREQIPVIMDEHLGWIQVLLVDSRHRRHGVGSKLLEHAENELKSAGVEKVMFGADLFHYVPGIPTPYEYSTGWVEKKGYHFIIEVHDFINRYRETEALPSISKERKSMYSILKIEEKDEFLQFMKRCFPGRWEYEAIKYFENGGTGREFVILKKGDKIIGFCRINDKDSPFIAQNVYWSPLFNNPIGGLGPLGIDEAERKQGFGSEIVKAGISYLRQRKMDQIIIDWTILKEFYNRFGFEVWKSYHVYKKAIN